jgi:NADPH:quinone reductase-like Zn-dependent oxidoreductase
MSCKAWFVTQSGSLDGITLKDVTMPTLEKGHVRIAVKALGLNFADVFSVLGLYNAAPKGEFIPGLEFSGVVQEVHEGEEGEAANGGFKKGDRVYGVARFGAFRSKIDVDVRYIRRFPDNWTFEQAAAFPVQALTAYYGLKELGNIKPGQTVLVHSAAGGVGLLTLQILAKIGANAITTVSSKEKADFLVSQFNLKPEQVIIREGAHKFAEQLNDSLSKCGFKGLDLVFDSLSGDYFFAGYNAMNSGGRLVVFGSGSLMPAGNLGFNFTQWITLGYRFSKRPKVDPMQLTSDNKSIMGFNLIWLYDMVNLFADLLQSLQDLNLDPPTVGKTFDFANMSDALKFFQSGKNVGKVAIVIKDE